MIEDRYWDVFSSDEEYAKLLSVRGPEEPRRAIKKVAPLADSKISSRAVAKKKMEDELLAARKKFVVMRDTGCKSIDDRINKRINGRGKI